MPSTTSSSYTHHSPVKHDPNPHPYPIKTTSTALLTRSNSSPHASQSGKHYYVPLASPGRSRSGSEVESASPNSSKGGHRYSRSLTSNLPASLPVPPSPTRSLNSLDLEHDQSTPPRRSTRSDSITSSPDLPPTPYELPLNPKTWSSTELSIYLTTALRSQSGETLLVPDRVARDITRWVREKGITGRTFMRLNDAELESMHLTTLWRTAILSASRILRQNVLKGQIWTDSSSPITSEELQSQAFDPSEHADASSASSSDVDFDFASNSNLYNGLSKKRGKTYKTLGRSTKKARGGGRVRGMVANWERSESESEGRDVDVPSLPPALGASQSLSASASPISPSSAPTSDYTTAPSTPSASSSADQEDPSSVDTEREKEQDDGEEPTIEALLAASDKTWGARAWEELDTSAGIITVKRSPDAQKTCHVSPSSVKKQEEREDEAKSVAGWEDVDVFGGGPINHVSRPPSTLESVGERLHNGKKDSVRLGLGRGSKGNANGKDERRIVTAIFSAGPEPQQESVSVPDVAPDIEKNADESEIVPSSLESGLEPSRLHDDDKSAQVDFKHSNKAVTDKQTDETERALARSQALAAAEAECEKQTTKLEARLVDNRALLEAFRTRLEEVERKIAKMEEHEATAPASPPSAKSSTPLTTSTELITRVLSFIYPPATSEPSDARPAEKERERGEDPTISSLPSYVLLVSIGLCAVVLKVALKRAAKSIKA